MQKSLAELFDDIPVGVIAPHNIPEVEVTGLLFDSRAVQPGNLFVAVTGGSADGHRFIPDAIARGAAAVVGSQVLAGLAVPYVQVPDSRVALAHLAAAWHDFPARQLTVIGVTGTDGKTTTSNLLYQIMRSARLKVGMISTVNAQIGDEVLDTGFHVTTPEAPDVQAYLSRMVAAGLDFAILEATSHGLAQERVTGCEFDIAVVTNITHEHLDYHGSYEAYRAAKARLFTGLAETPVKARGNPRLAVLNREDLSYPYLDEVTSVRKVSYGLQPGGELCAEDLRYVPDGIYFTARGDNFATAVHTRLLGAYNVSNCLAALSAAIFGLGIAPQTAAEGIQQLDSVPGRMEAIQMGQNFQMIVDFAHTPNALKRALESARQMTMGKVIAVFGSAGLRDRAKRRMMAETAAQLADVSIITAEDPRTESLLDILAEMTTAAVSQGAVEGESVFAVADRGEAIRRAVGMAREGDLVITCGKGHEQSMCFGVIEYPWDDRIAARAALAERLGVPGPAMPYLPTQD